MTSIAIEDPCLSISSTSSAATIIHCNTAAEQEATNDGGSIQNSTTTQSSGAGINNNTPSQQPSSAATPRPTRNQKIPFVLSGTLYYDLNANARRESNIAALLGEKRYLGRDVEYNVGLGGVTVQLVECRDHDDDDGDEAESSSTATDNVVEETTQVVTAVTIGVDVQGRPNLVLSGGDYNLVDIKVDRSYYINVKAPTGYLLTGGICNDELLGEGQQHQQWACGNHNNNGVVGTNSYGEVVAEWIPQQQQESQQQLELAALWQHNETNLGIAEGRSWKCVSVDKAGLTDSTLDIGVMRLGDVRTFVVGYHVVLDRDNVDTMTTSVDTFDDMNNNLILSRRRRRRMQKEVMMMMEQPASPLSTEDLDAIRNVVTEIFAVNLQRALLKRDLSFVQIDQVISLDVQYHEIRNTTAISDGGVDANEDAANDNLFGDTESDTTVNVGTTRNIFQKTQSNSKGGDKEDFFSTYSLSVDLIVKGHYRKDMDVSIRDGANTTTIQELLRNEMSGNTTQDELLLQDLLEYNPKCLEQMSKMKEPAFTLDGYSEVYSSKGILKLTSSPSRDDAFNSTGSTAFSAACANGNVLGFLMTDADEVEEVAVVDSTKVEEGQGALDKVATSTVEDPGFPWLPIALVCGLVGLGLIIFLVRRRRRRRATEKDGCDVEGASDTPSESKSLSGNERDKGGPMGTLLGLIYKNKKRVASKTAEFADIEAGLESGGELDDNDKPSPTTDVSEEESGKESSSQDEKHSGDDESKIVDQPDDKEAVKTEVRRTEEAEAEASNLEAPATSLNLDESEKSEMKSRRRRRQHRKKSNSDFANEPSQSKQHDTLRRSICDIDVGTKRMKGSRELSALVLGGVIADHEQDKKRSRRSRYTSNSQLSELDRKIHHEAYFAAESRRRRRKHNPLRQSIDDSNIGLRSRSTISTLNNTPKDIRRKGRKPDTLRKSQDDSNLGLRTAGAAAANVTSNIPPKERRKKSRKPDPSGDCSNIDRMAAGAANTTSNDAPKEQRRKSRKPDSLRKSQDDSNIGLRTAGAAAAANKDAKKTSRKKRSRKHDPLRSSQDDSNVGLRTARKKASKSESQIKRKKGRRQDPLRLSRCDVDIGTKRQPENLLALKDLSSKSGRHKHDRGTKDETDKRSSVKRSFSK